jgi:hypothetical protein
MAIRTLSRLPTGLADGLALKELAPHVALDVISPTQLGPPLSGMTRRLGLARHCIPPCRGMSNLRSAPPDSNLNNFFRAGASGPAADADLDNG